MGHNGSGFRVFTACSEDDDTVGDGGKPGEETGGNGGGANGSDSTAVPSPVSLWELMC